KGTWTRNYFYDEPNSSPGNNRLTSTRIEGDPTAYPYAYDPHGNMVSMSHLPLMQWNFMDQLQATQWRVANNNQVETMYYVYDGAGRRVRKVTDRADGTRATERIYVTGGFEIYCKYDAIGSVVMLARETLHVVDDKRRIALVETRTVD